MIFLFDKFKKLKGTVRNRHTISLLYERERNGLYTVSAEIPLKITDKKTVYNYHKKVKDSDFLGHYDREGRFQLHKIASVDIEDSSIFIRGVHLFFDEAKAGAIIQERRFRGSEIIDGARVAFDSIGWSVVDHDVSDTEDYIFYNVSPLEARAILVETFGFEFDYWLDFDGKNIRNKQISVKREMGKDSNKRYNYGHNVLNIKVEQDYSEIYTAVIGRGKGEDLGDDAYGRRIEYTDVEWKTPTHPMNKPKGSRVLHDENATQLFGYHEEGKVSPRTKVEIFDDIEDPAKLLRASYNWLRENSVPKAVFSLEVPDGDGLDLGDKVHVIYRDIDLVKHTRVTKVVDDLVSGNRDVEFGDTAYFKTDRRLSGVKSELKRVGGSMSSRISRLKAEFDRRFDNEVQQWKDDFEQALIDAEAAVEVMRVTMTEEFEAAQKAFEDEFNQSVAEAKRHADETAEEKAKQVQDNLDSFKGEHEQLVGELQGNIVDIDGELADARADVSDILGRLTVVDVDVSGIKSSLTEIEGTLSNTKTQLENQVSEVRGDLQKQLDAARAELDGLEVGGRNYIKDSKVIPMTSADSGARDNTEHISKDDYIEIKSNKDFQSYWYRYYALNTNNRITDESIFVYDTDYQTFGIDILTESDNFQMYINQRQTDHSNSYSSDTISLPNTNGKWQRVFITLPLRNDGLQRSVFYVFVSGGNARNPNAFSTNDYIRLKNSKLEKGNRGTDWTPAPEDTEQKITNINQTITNIEGELSSKVEQTEVDALKGTVTQQGTILSQTVEDLSYKAEKSVVDTLTGRVANAESSVTQNAEEISKRLTKAVYDEDKQETDAKITQWSNLTTETAEGLEQTISRLSTTEGNVTKAQADIIANADEIALRATQTELNSVTGRVSTAESQLSVQFGEISSLVGRVSDNEKDISSVVQDVNSITSTVATLESDVAAQGSQIEQTNDVISSKVWLNDIADIGANLVSTSPSAWEDGSYWSTGNENNSLKENIRLRKDLAVSTFRDVEYTFSCDSWERSNVRQWMLINYDTLNPENSTVIYIPRGQSRTIRTVGNRIVLAAFPVSGESVSISGFEYNPDSSIKIKLERGGSATPMLNAISQIEQKADEISSVVGRVSNNETNIGSVVQEISSIVQDVNSITSTVTSLENEVATQGSQITQTKDVIDSKVWLDDVANINPNLIPFTDVSAPESKPHWNNWGSGATNTWVDNLGYMNVDTTDTNGTVRIQSEEIDFVEGQEYTLSFLARTSGGWNTDGIFGYTFVLWPGQSSNQILGSANHTIEYLGNRLSGLRRYTHTFTARHTGKGRIMLGTYKFDNSVYSRFSFKEPKLEKGSERTPFLNAFSNIEQTANSIKLSVLGELDGGYVTKSEFDVTIEGIESRVAKIDGGGVLKQSDISVTSDSVIIGSQEITNTKLASIIAVSPSAVNIITNKLNLTGNLNVKGQVESIAMSAVKADFADLFAARVRAGAVHADHIDGFSARFNSLYTLNANMERLISQHVITRGVRALSIEAVEANIGSIRSKILTSDVVKSSHIASGTALIDKIYSSTAMFERMMSKSGFVRTLNTVTIDTDQITIRRPDGARLVNNGMLQASFDVQIRPNHASSAVEFTGLNYATSSDVWKTFEHFYTDHKGSKLLISWAVDFYGPSASEYIEVRVRGFGGNNPIGTSPKKIFSNGSTAYLNHTVNLGVPDYKTIQAYLEFRRSPTGSSAQNTVRARVLRVSIID